MVVSSSPAPTRSYAQRAARGNDDDVFNNGSTSNAVPNVWAARKEQMAARASASSSPTLTALSSLPPALNGGLTDTTSWPQVAVAAMPTSKDKEKTPTPTPKKSESSPSLPGLTFTPLSR